MSLNPRRPLTQQSMLPENEDELNAPELVRTDKNPVKITRWQRR